MKTHNSFDEQYRIYRESKNLEFDCYCYRCYYRFSRIFNRPERANICQPAADGVLLYLCLCCGVCFAPYNMQHRQAGRLRYCVYRRHLESIAYCCAYIGYHYCSRFILPRILWLTKTGKRPHRALSVCTLGNA